MALCIRRRRAHDQKPARRRGSGRIVRRPSAIGRWPGDHRTGCTAARAPDEFRRDTLRRQEFARYWLRVFYRDDNQRGRGQRKCYAVGFRGPQQTLHVVGRAVSRRFRFSVSRLLKTTSNRPIGRFHCAGTGPCRRCGGAEVPAQSTVTQLSICALQSRCNAGSDSGGRIHRGFIGPLRGLAPPYSRASKLSRRAAERGSTQRGSARSSVRATCHDEASLETLFPGQTFVLGGGQRHHRQSSLPHQR